MLDFRWGVGPMPALERRLGDLINGVLPGGTFPARGNVLQANTAATAEKIWFGEGRMYPILQRPESDGKSWTERKKHHGREHIVDQTTENSLTQLAGYLSLLQQPVCGAGTTAVFSVV